MDTLDLANVIVVDGYYFSGDMPPYLPTVDAAVDLGAEGAFEQFGLSCVAADYEQLLLWNHDFTNAVWTQFNIPTPIQDGEWWTLEDASTSVAGYTHNATSKATNDVSLYGFHFDLKKQTIVTGFPEFRISFSGTLTVQYSLRIDPVTGDYFVRLSNTAEEYVVIVDHGTFFRVYIFASDSSTNATVTCRFYPATGHTLDGDYDTTAQGAIQVRYPDAYKSPCILPHIPTEDVTLSCAKEENINSEMSAAFKGLINSGFGAAVGTLLIDWTVGVNSANMDNAGAIEFNRIISSRDSGVSLLYFRHESDNAITDQNMSYDSTAAASTGTAVADAAHVYRVAARWDSGGPTYNVVRYDEDGNKLTAGDVPFDTTFQLATYLQILYVFVYSHWVKHVAFFDKVLTDREIEYWPLRPPTRPAFRWPLISNLEPTRGDMDAFSLTRASDRTYINRAGEVQVARRTGKQLWYPSDPVDGTGFTHGDVTFGNYAWPTQPAEGTLENAVVYGDNSIVRYFYLSYTAAIGETARLSCYVIMDDGSVPVVGENISSGDFCVILTGKPGNDVISEPEYIGANVYRVSVIELIDQTTQNYGIVKYTGQSIKPFRCSGFMLENLG